jgi:hypothetical protein
MANFSQLSLTIEVDISNRMNTLLLINPYKGGLGKKLHDRQRVVWIELQAGSEDP